MKPHGGANFLKGIAGGITGVFTTFLKDRVNKIRIALKNNLSPLRPEVIMIVLRWCIIMRLIRSARLVILRCTPATAILT